MREQAGDLLDRFESVSLEALDERAALLRRIDNKYAVAPEQFDRLSDRLRSDHQVLEIGGRRAFAYSTVYFDTSDLRCFVDHLEDRVPRFKARSRLYEDTGKCVFEVKLKRSADETDKRQIDYPTEDRRRLTEDAMECLKSALAGPDVPPPEEHVPTISLSKYRVGMSLVGDAQRFGPQPGGDLFG